MRPKVLVLLASYNGERWLREQIDSVLSQAAVDVRIVASDDGSTDGSRALMEGIASTESRFALQPAAAPSGSAGANFLQMVRTLEAGDCTHVAFCDQDDIWHVDKLSTACACLVAQSAHLASSAVVARWPDGRASVLLQSARETQVDYLFEGAGQGCTFVMSSALYIRIHEFLRANAIPAVHYHDWLVYALSRSWGMSWAYDPQPHMTYRQHEANDTGARGSLGGIAKRVALIKTGWYARQVGVIMACCSMADPAAARVQSTAQLMDRAQESRWRRLRWSFYLLLHSRRRFSDRLVLSISALWGWL